MAEVVQERHSASYVSKKVPNFEDQTVTKPVLGMYSKQKTPFPRTQVCKDAWRRIENENKHIDRRLDSISKQTSGSQHTTLEHGNLQRKVQRTSNTGVAVGALDVNLPPRIQFVASEAGQPWSTSSSMLARVRHAREVQQSNAVLQGKLLSRYRLGHTDELTRSMHVKEIDCTDRWAQRTSLYSPSPPALKVRPRSLAEAYANVPTTATSAGSSSSRSKAAAAAASQPPQDPPSYTANLERASVPKSLGMASCSGCAVKCFYNADGRRLSRCRMCKQAWYCSETCAKLDWHSHKGLCKLNSSGFWSAFGPKPNEEYWVTNAAQGNLRRQLQQRVPTGDPETEIQAQFDLQEAYKSARGTELAAEQRQRYVEQLSLDGLAGPRPCMHRYGKPDAKLVVPWCGETIKTTVTHTKLLPPRGPATKP